ncbi:Aminoglycoside phosphotransferase [Neofusicoccum parvum]|uniref:Aminoglycoside phosphotransferase n=1 Tax=Neofusicoccum parvum TaxID=310453 RepID=A0ACB5S7T4_9PEZI|nr:Aminoglycoside phosphotransferase [Neofusicoccum parvum]
MGNAERRAERATSLIRLMRRTSDEGEEYSAAMSSPSEPGAADTAPGDSNTAQPTICDFPPSLHPTPPADLYEEQRARYAWTKKRTTNAAWISDIKATLRPYIDEIGIAYEDLSIRHFRNGGTHVLYTVRDASAAPEAPEFVFRITNSTFPWYKTESEVAAMELVSKHTTIPIPRVYAYDSSSENPIHNEWMLLSKLRGDSYARLADTLSLPQKLAVARTLADWRHQLSLLRFPNIGAIYRSPPTTTGNPRPLSAYHTGPTIDHAWTSSWRSSYAPSLLPRGPFPTPHALLCAYIAHAQHELQHDARQRAHTHLGILRARLDAVANVALLAALPFASPRAPLAPQRAQLRLSLAAQIARALARHGAAADVVDWGAAAKYPTGAAYADGLEDCAALRRVVDEVCGDDESAATVVDHHDVTAHNVLVDGADGAPVGLVDWEYVHAVPPALVEAVPPLVVAEADGGVAEQMLRAYDARLEELGSVLLDAGLSAAGWDLREVWELVVAAGEVDEEHRVGVQEMLWALEEEGTRGRALMCKREDVRG